VLGASVVLPNHLAVIHYQLLLRTPFGLPPPAEARILFTTGSFKRAGLGLTGSEPGWVSVAQVLRQLSDDERVYLAHLTQFALPADCALSG